MVVRVGHLGVQFERFSIRRQRLGNLALGAVDLAQIGRIRGIEGVQFHRFGNDFPRGVVSPDLECDQAQQVNRPGMARVHVQNPAVHQLGLLQAARTVMIQASLKRFWNARHGCPIFDPPAVPFLIERQGADYCSLRGTSDDTRFSRRKQSLRHRQGGHRFSIVEALAGPNAARHVGERPRK